MSNDHIPVEIPQDLICPPVFWTPFTLGGYLVYRSNPTGMSLFFVCFALSIISGLFGWAAWGSRMLHQLTVQESGLLSPPTCDTAHTDYESGCEGQIDLDDAFIPDDILADKTARIDEMLYASRRARLVHDFTMKLSDRAED